VTCGALGAALLAIGWAIAVQDPVSTRELDLFRQLNDVPDRIATISWPVMQLGSLGGALLVAAAVYLGSESGRAAGAVLAAGVLAWVGARVVKEIVERERPRAFVEAIVRDGSATGLGFVSGHTAVAFALATAVAPLLPRWGKVVVFTVATWIAVARIVHGVHLPADLVGGAGVGLLCGAGVHAAWRLLDPRSTTVDVAA
jgi:undecaprenyl-diphosphatase